MKRFGFILAFLLCAATTATAEQPLAVTQESAITELSAAVDPQALTLQECYQLALKRSETIAIDAELIKETEGRFLQALSTALPQVSFISSDEWQDGSGSSAFTLKHVPSRRFNVSQTLFSGFKEFASIAGAKLERRQRKEQKARAEQLLLVDVANAFHLLLEQREDMAALDAIRIALVERLDELHERERLGRSRSSEAKTIETQLRSTEADLELARYKEEVTRHLLGFLTGLDQVPAITDNEVLLAPIEGADYFLSKADTRADVLEAETAWKVSKKEVAVAQAQLWPTVTADANYYTDRAGVSQDIKWDVTLEVNVPLFQGGQAVGGIKEALSKARQARWHYVERQRSAELDIEDAYTKVVAAFRISALLDQALTAAEESYRLQVEDYRLSLVNNLDVLQALQTLEAARRSDIHGRREAKRLYWQLRAAIGQTV